MEFVDFVEWLENLPTQTLTDELKESIITEVDSLIFDIKETVFAEGITEGKEKTVEIIKDFLDDNL
jgi:hypothetical protein